MSSYEVEAYSLYTDYSSRTNIPNHEQLQYHYLSNPDVNQPPIDQALPNSSSSLLEAIRSSNLELQHDVNGVSSFVISNFSRA